MLSRRKMIKLTGLLGAGLALPAGCARYAGQNFGAPRVRRADRALVTWFSQTGNTARLGRLLAAVYRNRGMEVRAAEVRDLTPESLAGFDLLVVGGPVNHYDAPPPLLDWLARLPPLEGAAAAAFVTHGIPASNQHNTGCAILEVLAARGGAPVGLATFGNLGTYPPYWAFSPEKALQGRDFPNADTYAQARRFAVEILERMAGGKAWEFSREFSSGDVKKSLAPVWFSKLITDEHFIDRDRCIQCGRCVEKCPTGAVDPVSGRVDKSACIDCMGCINNCPAQAVRIVYWGKELCGYPEFLARNRIHIPEPRELAGG